MTEYSIYHGDCLEILKSLQDNSIDAIVSDPPFAFAGGISTGRSSAADTQFFSFWWSAVCCQLNRILKPEGEGFLWCDWRSAKVFADGFRQDQKYTWRLAQMLYHYREMPGLGRPFRNSVDMIAYLRGPKSNPTRIANTTHNWLSKYWYYGKHPHHPAEKSVDVAIELVKWCSDPGMVIIDPFMGSGTIGIACLYEKRDFIGVELKDVYFARAQRSLEKAASNFDAHCKDDISSSTYSNLLPTARQIAMQFGRERPSCINELPMQ